MTDKLPLLTVRSETVDITIEKDSVSVQPAYNITIGRSAVNLYNTIKALSKEDLLKLASAIEAFTNIID